MAKRQYQLTIAGSALGLLPTVQLFGQIVTGGPAGGPITLAAPGAGVNFGLSTEIDLDFDGNADMRVNIERNSSTSTSTSTSYRNSTTYTNTNTKTYTSALLIVQGRGTNDLNWVRLPGGRARDLKRLAAGASISAGNQTDRGQMSLTTLATGISGGDWLGDPASGYVGFSFLSGGKRLNGWLELTVDDAAPFPHSVTIQRWGYSLVEGASIQAGQTSAVPVELIEFSASARTEYVRLAWTTATEIDNAGFAVERSIDGATWTEVGYVLPQGDGRSQQAYAYDDRDGFQAGRRYYRLRQEDGDGTTTYSDIVVAEVSPQTTQLRVHPNPVNDQRLEVNLSLEADTEVTYRVFTSGGRVIGRAASVQSSGPQFLVSTAQLPRGQYYLEVKAGAGAPQYARFTVQ